MFIAATHNGISRLYETFGNAGADTLVRTLSPTITNGPGTTESTAAACAWSSVTTTNYSRRRCSSRWITSIEWQTVS